MGLVQETLGHTDRQAELHMALEPIVDGLWSEGERDFYWYGSAMYAYSCAKCFIDFSKGYSASFAEWLLGDGKGLHVGSVVDWGAGIGATSRLVEELTGIESVIHNYPSAGPQIAVANQMQVGQVLANSPQELGFEYDAVMAFELFEHVTDPLELVGLLEMASPKMKVLCEASSFHIDNYGHFDCYQFGGENVAREHASRRFSAGLKGMGYELVSSFWNNRPRVWLRS
jgi:hypothetical protein